MSDPVIAVLGVGAVGAVLAAQLHRAGIDVVAVARPDTAELIRTQGLTIRSHHFGDTVCRLPVVTSVPAGARVIVATKATALHGVLAALGAAGPTEVVTLLNGIEHMAPIRANAPTALVAGASVAVESTRLSPTVIEHKSPFFRLTVPGTAAESGIVRAWTAAGLDVTVGGTEQEVLWAKLRFLAPMALLTSFWRLPLGPALEHEPALTAALLADVAAIASGDGVPTDAEQLARALAKLPPGMRSSLQNDLDAGVPSELDAIGGALVRRGGSLGVSTETVQRLVTQLAER
ncbi:ketopantoate reductase family protein [Cryobacterium arcticum]|uniref:Ketopantoate reductase family protein n=1 Tax=Cryobacterium arcticum TaxID=670052 RepID=A0A317ZM48_9MICO|nr:2-dehydropantoate 2-reductase N-terminal domain-containing protein [Cryobacterium arcticum]PXA67506.1 ketopantoate reductase family protein [Cryobacterium arcticum]